MITDVLRLTRWELFKFRRRWVSWVLLVITAAISQLFLWGFFIAYQNDDITTGFSSWRESYSVESTRMARYEIYAIHVCRNPSTTQRTAIFHCCGCPRRPKG